jgi:hypothetical protein
MQDETLPKLAFKYKPVGNKQNKKKTVGIPERDGRPVFGRGMKNMGLIGLEVQE